MNAHARLKTGIDGLDLILDGGLRHPRGGSLLIFILGGPGTGKTHLALELTVRMLRESRGAGTTHLYYTFDQSPQELLAKLEDDFGYFGVPGEGMRVSGGIRSERYAALVHTLPGAEDERIDQHLVLASLRDDEEPAVQDGRNLFERLDEDLQLLSSSDAAVGTPLEPRLVTIDSISLAQLDAGGGVRTSLAAIRDHLAQRNMHGIFVLETPGNGTDRAAHTAAEYAADVIIQLGFHQFGDRFKERSLEITKARHQFYFRGTHHFSIVGRSGDELRGARGQRPAGIHIYPSIPTLLSHLQYRSSPQRTRRELAFGVGDLQVRSGSSNGLVGAFREVLGLSYVTLRYLLAGRGLGYLISLHETRDDLLDLACRWWPDLDAATLEQRLQVHAFEPEYLSSGKFLKDVHDELEVLRGAGHTLHRVALLGLGHLRWGFPLLHDADILIPWLQSFFRHQGLTTLFVEARPGTENDWEEHSAIAGSVDNLLRLDRGEGGPLELELSRALSARVSSPAPLQVAFPAASQPE